MLQKLCVDSAAAVWSIRMTNKSSYKFLREHRELLESGKGGEWPMPRVGWSKRRVYSMCMTLTFTSVELERK